MFFREIEFLIRLSHPCVVRFVGYYPATGGSAGQIGTEFAVNGSLREALHESAAFLDDTGKAIVIAGVVVGMEFIHSQGVIHGNLEPRNIFLDGRGYPKIANFRTSPLSDFDAGILRADTPWLYTPPTVYDKADYTPAVDVYAFSLIFYELLFGCNIFSLRRSNHALVTKFYSGYRPSLPPDMDGTVWGIIFQCWSVAPSCRGSFEEIFGLLHGIEFKITPAVDSVRVYKVLSEVGCNCGSVSPPDNRTDGTADCDAVQGRDGRASGTG
jgi:serine/threonine protein kinase